MVGDKSRPYELLIPRSGINPDPTSGDKSYLIKQNDCSTIAAVNGRQQRYAGWIGWLIAGGVSL